MLADRGMPGKGRALAGGLDFLFTAECTGSGVHASSPSLPPLKEKELVPCRRYSLCVLFVQVSIQVEV